MPGGCGQPETSARLGHRPHRRLWVSFPRGFAAASPEHCPRGDPPIALLTSPFLSHSCHLPQPFNNHLGCAGACFSHSELPVA